MTARITADTQGRITSWDSGAEEMFGSSSSEAIGRLLVETIIPARYRETHIRAFTAFVQGSRTQGRQGVDVWALRQDGLEIPVTLAISRDGDAIVGEVTERVVEPSSAWDAAIPVTTTRPRPLSPWEQRTDAEIRDLRGQFERLYQGRQDAIRQYGTDELAPREKGLIPAMLHWFAHMGEVVLLAGQTRLQILEELVERRATRFRFGKWSAVLITLLTAVISVVATVLLTELLSRWFPSVKARP